jgi:serine/threonine protein kinase
MDDPRCYKCDQPISLDDTNCGHCQAPLILLNKYPVQSILRETNDNGTVYRAWHPGLEIDLVIKRAPPSLAKHIQNESRILYLLRRPINFTPHVYDFEQQRDHTILVMEWIDGRTLDHVHPQQLWPVAEVQHFLNELLQHLEELHSVGIIHRDLKPQNIIRRPNDSYALIDFNVAKRTGEKTEYSGYSRQYAPPEQLPQAGGRVASDAPQTDERSDLYSLAVTAYELLFGHVFDPKKELMPQLNRLRAQAIPLPLRRVLRHMLAPEMTQRPANAAAARRMLNDHTATEDDGAEGDLNWPAGNGIGADQSPLQTSQPTQMSNQLSSQAAQLNGQLLHLKEGQGRIIAIAWSPNSSELAIATACGIRIYSLASDVDRLFRPTRSPVRQIGYAMTGNALAFTLDEKIEVRHVDTSEPIRVLSGYAEATPGMVVFAPAGQTLAVATDEALSIHDIERNLVLAQQREAMIPQLLVSSQNGQILATSSGDTVTLWHIQNASLTPRALRGDIPTPVVAMAISADGQTLAVAAPNRVKLWKAGQPQPDSLIRPDQYVRHIALSPDGQRIAIVLKESIQIAYAATNKLICTIALADHAADIFQIIFDRRSARLAAASPGQVSIWDSAKGAPIARLVYTDTPRAIAFTLDGRRLASAGQKIQLWHINAGSGTPASQISHTGDQIHDLLFAQDEKSQTLIAADRDSITAWKRGTPTPASPSGAAQANDNKWQRLGSCPGAHVQAHGIAYVRQGRSPQLLQATRESINMHPIASLNSGRHQTFRIPAGYDIALGSNGWVASLSTDNVVRVWQASDPQTPYELQLNVAPNSIAIAPDGQTLAVGTDDAIQIWSVPDGSLSDTQSGIDVGGERIIFAPDGTTLAATRHNEIAIWQIEANRLHHVCTARDHTDRVTNVAFAADWRTFASTSDDGTIRLWTYAEQITSDHGVVHPPSPPEPPTPPPPLRIFLCHVIEDQDRIDQLSKQLAGPNVDIWTFGNKFTPGQRWPGIIQKMIRQADIFIACLSNNFINKLSYAHREIEFALQIAKSRPEEQIYIIPLRLDTCDVPEQLRVWQWVDYFDGSEPARLIQTLRERADEVARNDKAASTNEPPLIPGTGASLHDAQTEQAISEVPDIQYLHDLLATNRGYLRVLHKQLAIHGEAFAPPRLLLEITAREETIRKIKAQMRKLGIPYTDEYGDGPSSSDLGLGDSASG